MIIRRTTLMLTLAVLMMSAFGCVSQHERDNLQTLYRKSREQVIDLKAQLEDSRAQIDALRNAPPPVDNMTAAKLAQVTGQRDQLVDHIKMLEARIREAAKAPIQLPPEIDQALTDLARQHAELMTYDQGAGMVQLRSDLTFSLGSAKVSDQANKSLGDLAAVLGKVVGQGYEIRVVGHTDNVPIRRAATRTQHPTNWHLSVHRAIAVKDALQSAGVPPVRLTVAGHGEYRPIAANGSKGNEANRRVEIYIVPNTYTPKFPTTPAQTPAAKAPAEDQAPIAPVEAAPVGSTTNTPDVAPDVTPEPAPEPPAPVAADDPVYFK